MIIDRVISIKNYILAVYYCSDDFYRLCIISNYGTVFNLDDIFYCRELALKQGIAIIKTIA